MEQRGQAEQRASSNIPTFSAIPYAWPDHSDLNLPVRFTTLYQETPQSTQSVRPELVEAHRPFDKLRANGKMEVVTVRGVAGKDDP